MLPKINNAVTDYVHVPPTRMLLNDQYFKKWTRISTEKLEVLKAVSDKAIICRPEGIFQESAARGLVDFCVEAIGAIRTEQGINDIEAKRLRKEAQKLQKKVNDSELLELFETFDALLKKRD